MDPALWMAALMGNEEEVRRFVADGADVEEKSTLKTRSLHVAATMGHTAVHHSSSSCTPPPCARAAVCCALR